MTIFDTATIRTVERHLSDHFTPRRAMSYKDAKTLIDHVAGPASMPRDVGATDYSAVRVSGGGGIRPSEQDVEALLIRVDKRYEETSEWRPVIGDFLRRLQGEPQIGALVRAVYRDGLNEAEACQKLKISRRTYYSRRSDALNLLATLAAQEGLVTI